MSLFPILIVLILVAWDADVRLVEDGAVVHDWAVWGIAFAAPLALVGALWAVVRVCRARLNRGGGAQWIIIAERAVRWTRLAILAAHAAAAFGLNWLGAVRHMTGDLVLVDEAIGLLPPLLGFIATLWVYFPIEQRIHQALLVRRLDEGKQVFPALTRGAFVLHQSRLQLLLLLVPILMIIGLSEAVRLMLDAASSGHAVSWVADGAGTLSALVVFITAPLFVPLILSVTPLPRGEMRDCLQRVASRHRVRIRRIYEWSTGGTTINAAVMGLIGPLRVVLMTDALLACLEPRQLEAVMAHEIGHVRRHHMPWLALSMAASIVAASVVVHLGIVTVGLVDARLLNMPWVSPTVVEQALTAGIILAALIAFAWVSRRFERQADTFAVQHLSGLTRSGTDERREVDPEAVRVFCSALGAIATLNMADPRGPSWRHGSIAWRMRYLRSIIGLPLRRLPIDRLVRRIKLAVLLALVTGSAAEYGLRALHERILAGEEQIEAASHDEPPLPIVEGSQQENEMTAIPFSKMEGLGNDYIYIDGFAHDVADPADLAQRISDRHFGVGSDGLILVLPPEDDIEADVRMRMFNADGSESEMCGNGVRCVCKFARDRGLSDARPMRIQTGRGVLTLEYELNGAGRVGTVTVDMGVPILQMPSVGVSLPRPTSDGRVIGVPLSKYIPIGAPAGWMSDCDFHDVMTAVSMGNPHLVVECGCVDAVPLEEIGRFIERQPLFPNRINVHFVQVNARDDVTMRTWERGTGITLACGTGACAVAVACALRGLTERRITAHLPGGELLLEWDELTNHVFKTGPATHVFDGVWDDSRTRAPVAVQVM